MVLVSLSRCGRQDWMKHSPRRMAPLNWSLFGATKLHTLGGTHILCYTLGQCMCPRWLLLLLLLRAIAHRLQFHMAPWSFTSSSCLMSSEICLNPNFIHNWPDEMGPSILHWLSHYYTGWLQIIFMTGERLTHLTVSVNDLRISFGLRCLSRSGYFHARF